MATGASSTGEVGQHRLALDAEDLEDRFLKCGLCHREVLTLCHQVDARIPLCRPCHLMRRAVFVWSGSGREAVGSEEYEAVRVALLSDLIGAMEAVEMSSSTRVVSHVEGDGIGELCSQGRGNAARAAGVARSRSPRR